jgi:hypothetical protein
LPKLLVERDLAAALDEALQFDKQLKTIMVRRLKSELEKNWDGTPRFARRVVKPLEVASLALAFGPVHRATTGAAAQDRVWAAAVRAAYRLTAAVRKVWVSSLFAFRSTQPMPLRKKWRG